MASWLFLRPRQISTSLSKRPPPRPFHRCTGFGIESGNLRLDSIKTVPARDAMRSLKRRLLHKNPNVQLATLHLVDVCIMNGGIHFLIEISSREFMDSLVLVLKPLQGQPNPDVKHLALECIQNWAKAFEGQLQLSYVGKIYNQLKDEGK